MTEYNRVNGEQYKKHHKTATLVFFVNGKKVIDGNPEPESTLLTYLRDKLGLCGTKLGCGEGGCGACTVMVSKVDKNTNCVKHVAVNACLTPVCAMHGNAVTTIEGIGSTRTRLHPVQERIAKAHGSQCGFCTPGIVMSMYALLRNSSQPNMKELEIAFQGNLCRCTGYRPIIEGYKTFTKEFACGMGEKCCKMNGKKCLPENIDDELFKKSEFLPYDATQEPIFPPELKISDDLDKEFLCFKGPRVTWYRPTTIDELLQLKNEFPDAKIVVGNTEIGVEVKFKHFHYPVLINSSQIKELNEIRENENGIFLGASANLIEIEKVLRNQIKILPEHETRLYQCIVDMMHYFAGKQIRNVASLGGNIMTGSPISDMTPILTAARIELVVGNIQNGKNTLRSVRMGEGFFTAYRRNVIQPHEVLVGLKIPKTTKNQFMIAFKQAKRRDDDIAIVNAAFNIVFVPGSNTIESIHMAFGGMAPTTVLAPQTCKEIIGQKWDENLVEKVCESLCKELPLSPSAPGGMISYRRSLVTSLFFKTYLSLVQKLEKENILINISDKERSGAEVFHTPIPKSAQLFEKPLKSQSEIDPIGLPKVHSSAYKQASGEAVYCDDIPKIENELYLALVLSSKAHAKLISIDPTDALKLDGVHAFYSSKDLSTEENSVGAVFYDEEIFASKEIICFGQVIGAIVADNQPLAQRASRMVKVVYEEITPIIVSIEDAIKYNSYYSGFPKVLQNGNIEESFQNADHIVEGSCRMGGQEHFYLETHAALAIPKDGDEMEIFCSTQHPSEIQKLVGHSLSIPSSRVVCRVKRLGGGFGGKESRCTLVSLPVAIAAYKLRRPVRCMLDRDEDMTITGTRHPFSFKYKVACTKNGKITGCDIDIYANAGCSSDLSYAVMERAVFHYQNTYLIPNVKITSWLCKTNLPSNTAFRGFGGPQGMFAGEYIIRDVAKVCEMDYVDVAYQNMYKTGDITHYNQIIENDNTIRCWNDCIKQSNFYEQRKEVEEFNKQNRWKKRGVAIVPTMYGISFTVLHLNQGGALINIYDDGSVLLTHGGTEMGQGVHIKMIQVASKALGIPHEKIHITETATDKVPNTSPTAASCGSDLNGGAVVDACRKLNNRLEPIKNEFPTENWEFWIKKAYMNRISLSATGFYKTPGINYDRKKNTGKAFAYYTNGAAVSSVEIDCLTGDHQVLKTDIVMDIGSSLNPAIDIGQIEGAFMQGYGLFTLEEMIYSPNGTVFSRGPGMYKLPGFADIPAEFNVSILTGAPNPRAVYSSKAVGEPPLFLAATVFFAIKEAIAAARKEQHLNPDFNLVSPATSARIRMSCEDKFTKMIDEPNPETFIEWNKMA